MKNLLKIGLLTTLFTVPVYAHAQENAMPQKGTMMQCPMMEDMTSLQKDMGSMMGEMGGMMESMPNPAMKERMQAMHDHMATMMAHMQKMQEGMGGMMKGGMMGGPMMRQGEQMDSKSANDIPAAVAPEDDKQQ